MPQHGCAINIRNGQGKDIHQRSGAVVAAGFAIEGGVQFKAAAARGDGAHDLAIGGIEQVQVILACHHAADVYAEF